jgi:hypothetical protein
VLEWGNMNKKISTPIALGIVLILAILVGSFIVAQYLGIQKENFDTTDLINQQKIEATTIKDITINPQQYENKEIVIDGWYGGWDGAQCNNIEKIAMRTKSDALIYDNTGCLYMCGDLEVLYKEKELNPSNNDNIGGKLKIRGTINLIEGKPCIGSEEEIKQTEILKDELTGWNIYRNLLYSYEIEYPPSYNDVNESDQAKEVIIGNDVMPYYGISVKEKISSLDELKSLMEERIKKMFSEVKIKWKDTTVLNEKAIEMSYESFAGGYTGVVHETGVMKDSAAYIIMLINGSEAEYYKILSTFKFVENVEQKTTVKETSFSYPYPVVWEEQNQLGDDIEFSLTKISLGERLFESNQYTTKGNIYALTLYLKINVPQTGGAPCVALNIGQELNEQGDFAAPINKQFYFADTVGCLPNPGKTYYDQEVIFKVPETEKSFTFTTRGKSNIFFMVNLLENGQFKVGSVSSMGEQG